MEIYLLFNGKCEEAINCYKDAIGGNIRSIMHFGDAPMPTPEGDKNKVMHAVVEIDGTTIMCSDAGEGHPVTIGSNFSLSLNFTDEARMKQVFDTLSGGGVATMPPQETFWAKQFAMCTDKFGINWMLSYGMSQAG